MPVFYSPRVLQVIGLVEEEFFAFWGDGVPGRRLENVVAHEVVPCWANNDAGEEAPSGKCEPNDGDDEQ